ncbi:hypothetical protein BHE74_00040783 [Ensete ventricosum]|nr:hypothetical protein BHE74_00040783 [Ensete ventricosum]
MSRHHCSDLVTAPTPAQPAVAPSPLEVQEIPLEEATETFGKCPTEAPSGRRKKAKVLSRHKSHREGEKSKSRATEGKKPIAPIKETPTPRATPNLVKELCSARPGEDCRDYHVIRVSSQPEHAPDAPLEVNLSPLMHEKQI